MQTSKNLYRDLFIIKTATGTTALGLSLLQPYMALASIPIFYGAVWWYAAYKKGRDVLKYEPIHRMLQYLRRKE
jgi:hypothetical protein